MIRADLNSVHHINYTPQYSASHSSAYISTLKGLTAATGGIEATFNLLNDEDKANLRVIYRTRETPSHPFMSNPKIPEAIQNKLIQAWLELSSSPEWDEALAKVPFDHLIKTRIDDYKVLEDMDLDRYYLAPAQ